VFSRISGRENSGGASFHAPPSLAVRGPTRSRKKFQAAGASAAASSPLPFPRRRRQHRYLQNNQNATQAVDFSFHFLCFSNLLRFLPFLKICPVSLPPLQIGHLLLLSVADPPWRAQRRG